MEKKTTDSQLAGIKAHAVARNNETVNKVNAAIDKLKKKGKIINFESVSKAAGISRATLYNNAQLKERILSLRAISKSGDIEKSDEIEKDKVRLKDERIVKLRDRVKQLEEDKRKLILQLVDYEELKSENERLRNRLVKN